MYTVELLSLNDMSRKGTTTPVNENMMITVYRDSTVTKTETTRYTQRLKLRETIYMYVSNLFTRTWHRNKMHWF